MLEECKWQILNSFIWCFKMYVVTIYSYRKSISREDSSTLDCIKLLIWSGERRWTFSRCLKGVLALLENLADQILKTLTDFYRLIWMNFWPHPEGHKIPFSAPFVLRYGWAFSCKSSGWLGCFLRCRRWRSNGRETPTWSIEWIVYVLIGKHYGLKW